MQAFYVNCLVELSVSKLYIIIALLKCVTMYMIYLIRAITGSKYFGKFNLTNDIRLFITLPGIFAEFLNLAIHPN